MKEFLKKVAAFSAIVALLCCSVFLPATPRISQSLIFADRQKDALLRETPSPRIIFIGGSNLSFGLNSRLVKEATGLNPVNTGLHARLGLKYMLDNTLRFVLPGDILLLAPEYDYFYEPYDECSKELSRIIFDVDLSKIHLLSKNQITGLMRRIPKYFLSKIKPREYWGFDRETTYGRDAFNEYGDAVLHWELPGIIPALHQINGSYNPDVTEQIRKFGHKVTKKGASLLISFPGLHRKSFESMPEKVNQVAFTLQHSGLQVISRAENYFMPDELMFDSAYHLNKKGIDIRTAQLIDDLINAGIPVPPAD
jgi:hypothetical protein